MIEPGLPWILSGAALGLITIGLAGMVLSRHLFRVVLALAVAEAGANLLLVIAGYRREAIAPILDPLAEPVAMVDPVPQAMVLTAIVIGVGVQALAVSILIRIRQHYGTLERGEVAERMDGEIAAGAGTPRDVSQEAPLGTRPPPPLMGHAAQSHGSEP